MLLIDKMRSRKLFKDLNLLSRKVHIHLGLFLLLFIWLFAYSGLLLNHGDWNISHFWEKRTENSTVTSIHVPDNRDSSTVLKNIISQLKIEGEITDVNMWPDSLHFRVSRPGQVRSLQVNFTTGLCTQKTMQYNLAGKIQTLHTFNGVNKNNTDLNSNWLITSVWRLSMDLIAAGLLLLCISSWIMWYKIRQNYGWGWMVLILGFAGAIYFTVVLGLL